MYRKIIIALAALAAVACGGNTAKPVAGNYAGTIPAADCPGIAVSLTLSEDGSYESRSEYLGRDAVFREYGRYTVEGERLTLYPDEGEAGASYRIEPERLRMLDRTGERIEGALADHYVLTRQTDR